MENVPAEYIGFVQEKQLQILFNVLSSSAAGVAIANAAALLSGDASGAVFAETLQTQLPLLALTGIASAATIVLKK